MALIGRADELAAIVGALDGDAPIVVVGEAGIGKTTLVRAAVAATARPIHEGGAFATLAWMPYLVLERALGGPLSGDADWVADAVERRVGPDVLFVDDAQWADERSMAAIERLAGRISVVVATRRGDEGTAAVLAALGPAGPVILELAPLDPDDAARVALATEPGLTHERAAAIGARAGGNPFVVEQLAVTGEPTSGLRRAIAARLDGLEPSDRQLLGMLALAGRPLPTGSVDGHERLVRNALAVLTPDGGVAMRHALLADAVVDDLLPDEAGALHARLAAIVDDDGERARHLAAAGDPGAAHAVALRAVASSTTPGERAANLGVAATTADGAEANSLRIEAASALRVAGDLATAASLLDTLERPDDEAAAMAEATRARIEWSAGDPDAMRATIARGLALVAGTDSPAEALLRAESVTVTALVDGRFDEGLDEAEAAILLAHRAGADPTRALLLRATILAGLGRPGWADALAAVIESARATGDVETELSAANNLVSGHEMHGDPASGLRLAASMADRARDLRLTAWERQFGALVANLDLHAGHLELALRRSENLLDEALDPLAAQQVGLTAGLALVDLGRHEEAVRVLDRLLAVASPDVTGRGDVLFVLAEAALWGGLPDEALTRLEAYREFEGSEYPTSFLVDVTAGWAALEAGRAIPRLCAIGEPAGMLVGARLEREAIEAAATDDDLAASALFDRAGAAYEGFHRRGELRCGWAAAEWRRRAGDPAAVTDLEALEAPLARDGFGPLLVRVHRSLRLLGERRAVRAPATGAARLTAREQEIATLVARGLTNQEIARRMGLGRPTVARLLSNGMVKLGVDSRGQVAARVGDLV
jgi:DNA-binding CsgD family transcriptional regulator/tetratricopeptide (TPR) repeat protein